MEGVCSIGEERNYEMSCLRTLVSEVSGGGQRQRLSEERVEPRDLGVLR